MSRSVPPPTPDYNPQYQNFLTPAAESAYNQFLGRYVGCQECSLYQGALNYVWFRGIIPADILFIGEAPGLTEDAVGRPFIGPSGKLLDTLICSANEHRRKSRSLPFTYAITNSVSCVPLSSPGIIRQPTKDEASACSTRLLEFATICQPAGTVLVGEVAKKLCHHIPTKLGIPYLHVKHPAYLLRQGARSDKVLLYKTWYLSLCHFLGTLYLND